MLFPKNLLQWAVLGRLLHSLYKNNIFWGTIFFFISGLIGSSSWYLDTFSPAFCIPLSIVFFTFGCIAFLKRVLEIITALLLYLQIDRSGRTDELFHMLKNDLEISDWVRLNFPNWEFSAKFLVEWSNR